MKGETVPKLPVQQLTILSICRFAEPVALTSVFPYLPEMIESFNVPEKQVAKWAGVTSAVFSLAQSLTGIPWGRASDRFGRKPVILVALLCTMTACILFGFSRSLAWAIMARAIAGMSNGNVGIIRTTVAELVPEKELQPRAFSIMPLIWTIGSIFGPAFGGALANPAQRYPALFGQSKFLKEFPFALPNLVACVFFTVGLTTGFLFLRETLDSQKNKRDVGLILGQALLGSCSKQRRNAARWEQRNEDRTPLLLDGETAEGSNAPKSPSPSYHPPGWADVFTTQSNINLLVYTMLAMHSVAFDQLLPIFMHHVPQEIHGNPDVKLPFKFSGGFGINSGRIGTLFTMYGAFGMVIQFFVFPPLCRKFGVLTCLKVSSIAFPFLYILTPFSVLFPTDFTKQAAVFALMLLKSWLVIFAFPCSTILLTNSASSLRILGTLNGVATSVSALGRATGPALGGGAFTRGVEIGYVILPWWILALIACIGAIPVFFLVEMDGFSASAEGDSGSSIISLSGSEATLSQSPPSSPRLKLHPDSTRSSDFTAEIPVLTEESEAVFDDEIEEGEFALDDSPLPGLTKTASHSSQLRHDKRKLRRRMSSPIGLGENPGRRDGTTARRFSTNLGATRSGLGSGGQTFVS